MHITCKTLVFSLIIILCSAVESIAQETNNNSETGRYSGNYRMGMRHGRGTFIWPDGSKYTGQWRNDKMDGRGTFTAADGSTYEGNWEEGQRSGYGVYKWGNGDKYEGFWKNNMKHGEGRLSMKDGSSHEGFWANDAANGYGEHVWATGTRYMGNWRNNQRHGDGVMIYADGRIEQGSWANDQYMPCKCVTETQSVAEAFTKADIVVAGKITGFTEGTNFRIAVMEVTQYWKGNLQPGRNLYIQIGTTSCDWVWFKDESYLLYGVTQGVLGSVQTNLCNRTQRLSSAQADIDALNELIPCKSETIDRRAVPNNNEFDPVCGCDGVTYKNRNDALRNGVIKWTAGRCDKKEKN